MDPALARGLGVMLKLDFHRAALQRILRLQRFAATVAQHSLLADQYHGFARLGEEDRTGDECAFLLSGQRA